MEKVSRVVATSWVKLLLGAWGLYLFLQGGDWWDESEHCHATWLIAVQKLSPFRDFFQHHSPILWDFLSIYYKLGGTGLGIMLFGRLLVLGCALMVAGGLWVASGPPSADRIWRFTASLLVFVAFTLSLETLFVIRPETLSLAFAAIAIAFWKMCHSAQGSPQEKKFWTLAVASGVLWGLSLYASPRTVLASPLFLVFMPFSWRGQLALGGAVCGSIVGIAGYSFIMSQPLSDYAFLVAYSTELQKVGEFVAVSAMYMGGCPFLFGPFLIASTLLCRLYFTSERNNRLRILFHGGWAVVAFVIASYLCWPHCYPQNYAPVFFYLAFAIADGLGRVEKPALKWLELAVPVGVVWVIIAVVQILITHKVEKEDFLSSYRFRQELLGVLKPGETVLMPYHTHPIAVADASYYGTYLLESGNRLCSVAAKFPDKLPPCHLLSDMQTKRPALIEKETIQLAVGSEQREALNAFVNSDYKFWSARKTRVRTFIYYQPK